MEAVQWAILGVMAVCLVPIDMLRKKTIAKRIKSIINRYVIEMSSNCITIAGVKKLISDVDLPKNADVFS